MKNVFAIAMSGLAALALAVSLEAPAPAESLAPAAPTGDTASALLTAWWCPITDRFFTNPLTCRAHCSGFTCPAVTQ